jgi:hypothetical protein
MAGHQALVRGQSLLRRCLAEWIGVHERIEAKMSQFGEGMVEALRRHSEEARVLESGLGALYAAFEAAEADRVEDPRRGARVNPLDALARGALGAETGHLVHSLRLYGPLLRQAARGQQECRLSVSQALEQDRAMWKGAECALLAGHVKTKAILREGVTSEQENLCGIEVSGDSKTCIERIRGKRRTGLSDINKCSTTTDSRPTWTN